MSNQYIASRKDDPVYGRYLAHWKDVVSTSMFEKPTEMTKDAQSMGFFENHHGDFSTAVSYCLSDLSETRTDMDDSIEVNVWRKSILKRIDDIRYMSASETSDGDLQKRQKAVYTEYYTSIMPRLQRRFGKLPKFQTQQWVSDLKERGFNFENFPRLGDMTASQREATYAADAEHAFERFMNGISNVDMERRDVAQNVYDIIDGVTKVKDIYLTPANDEAPRNRRAA